MSDVNPAEPKWTPSQLKAIRHVDGALLVSAAAGSGKTAVLAERCAYLVCDAPEPCDVDALLVLTFTRAAAAEMRSRIDAVIRRKAAEPDAPPRILRQLRLIDRAQITTLDAFCGSLVRSYFHLVGIDPGAAILAPEDATLLQNDVAESIVDAEYDGPDAAIFKQLLDGYFNSGDENLRRRIISAHGLMQSIVDPEAWARQAIERLEAATVSDNAPLMRRFAEVRQRELRAAIRQLGQIARRARPKAGLAAYADHADAIAVELGDLLMLSEALRFDDLSERVKDYAVPSAPRIKSDVPDKKPIQDELNRVKGRIKKGGDLRALMIFSSRQLRADMTRIVPPARYFLQLVERFAGAYTDAKRRIRSLDFADTETLALRILNTGDGMTPSSAAIELQARYRHVLVDEYQDINPLQNAILRLVSRDRGAELSPATMRSNFFTVGDVKQSIYGFRLAEPRQFIERHASLTTDGARGRVIPLQENFRSRAPLLEAVNDVFRLLMTEQSATLDYDVSQELRSLNDYPPIPSEIPHFKGKPIELHLLPRDAAPPADGDEPGEGEDAPDSFDREIALVARRIRELVCDDESKHHHVMAKGDAGLAPRPIRYGDIAVLLRTRRVKSSQMADALRALGIPVHADDSSGFFAAVEVQDVLSVLRILSNGRQDIPLAALIRSPLSGVSDKDNALATIRGSYPDEPFHRAVMRYSAEQDDPLANELKAMLKQLDDWRRIFQERQIGESLLKVYDHNHFITFCRALPDGAQRVANLQELLERAQTFDGFERQGLDRFLTFITELESNDQLGRPSLAADSTDVVRVMTVHKSKGLEFPIVIIPDLGKRFNEQSLSNPILLDRDWGIGMTAVDLTRRVRYPSAASVVVRDHMRRKAIAEEIRVLYVALTRAREHLILIGSTGEDAMDGWRIDWADHDGPLPDETIQDASTALGWIGPIAAITERRGLGTFAVTDRTAKADESEASPEVPQNEDSTKPCGPDETTPLVTSDRLDDADAVRAVERIEYQYPFAKAAEQPSTLRASEFIEAALPEVAETRTVELVWPAIYKPSDRPKSLDIGSATHRLLELIDFHATRTASDVAREIGSLVDKRLLSESEASLIDREAIAWFAQTPLADEMRRPEARLLREQSLARGVDVVEEGEAGDFALLRGRVDAVIVRPADMLIIDYKSDRVRADQLEARAGTYAMQVITYADALARLARRPVTKAALVFLNARQIVDVPLAEASRR